VSAPSTTCCPRCNEAGTTVKPITLESLLTEDAQGRLQEARYRFCETSTCETVYFPEDGSEVFEKSDLTVRVGIKEVESPRPVCYCFDHSVEEIEGQLGATGETDVLADIEARMQEACWCETKSPQGRCCLGLVTRVVREARAALGQAPGAGAPPPRRPRAERTLGAAALLAALAASACCWLPLGLAALGLSGAAASTYLLQLRPQLLLATAALLAAAFLLARRPAGVTGCCGPEPGSCEPGGAVSAPRRWLWVTGALALALASFPSYSGALVPAVSLPSVSPGSRSWVLEVRGMTCAGCAAHVRSTLEAVPGVEGAVVHYEARNAEVVATSAVSRQALAEALEAAGYSSGPAPTSP